MTDRSKYQKDWYEKNKQDHIARSNNYYTEHREEVLDKVKIFRKYNPFLEVVSFKGDQVFKVTHKHLI